MSLRSIFCIAPSRDQADRIVHDLQDAEFVATDISALYLDRSANDGGAAVNDAAAPAGAAAAPSAVATRGLLGKLTGLGPLLIPGVDPLIVAGPIAATLSGATVGGIAGGLIEFGVPELEAGCYEGKIKAGHVLLSVCTENSDKGDRARAIFRAAGAEDIRMMMVVSARGVRRGPHLESSTPPAHGRPARSHSGGNLAGARTTAR